MPSQPLSSVIPPQCVDTGPLWNSFISEPGLSVALMRTDGVYEYVNPAHADFFLNSSPEQITGRHVRTVLPKIVYDEVMETLTQVSQTSKGIIRRVVWHGRQVHCFYRALYSKSCNCDRVLVSSRWLFDEGATSQDIDVREAGFIELGELDALSTRELEVLAMLGRGLRTREIAKSLFRSAKTIDAHLSSIRKKTRTTDRAVLMRIANEAGLDSAVVTRPRVRSRLCSHN